MSFSGSTREELARVYAERECCKLAELSGLVRSVGALHVERGQDYSLWIPVGSPPVARKAFRLCKDVLGLHGELMTYERTRPRRRRSLVVKVRIDDLSILRKLHMLDESNLPAMDVSRVLGDRDCCRRAYLRGLFLAAGYLSDPGKEYHLELTLESPQYSEAVLDLVHQLGAKASVNARKDRCSIYVKRSQDIALLLALMGAHSAMLSMESMKVYKDVKNQVNRLVNAETANVDKTVHAALRQIRDIEVIDRSMGLSSLPTALRMIARVRLENPYASMRELGDLTAPPISKSGVSNRFRRLHALADRLRSKSAEPAPEDQA